MEESTQCVLEALKNLGQHEQLQRKWAFRAVGPDPLLDTVERLAMEILHCNEVTPIINANLV